MSIQLKLDNKTAGYVLMITALILYVLSDTICKLFLMDYSAQQVTLFRTVSRLLPIMIACIFMKHNPLKTSRLHEHLIRAVIASMNTFLFMCAYKYAPMTDVYAIGYTSPFFILVFGYLMLKEKLSINAIVSVCIGLIGAMIILQPKFDGGISHVNVGAAFALTASILAALNNVLIKKLSTTEHILTIVFFHAIVSLVFSFPLAISSWHSIIDMKGLLIGFTVVGIISAICQCLISYALSISKVSNLAATNYVTLLPVILIDSFYWNTFPQKYVIVGMVLIIICNYLVIRKQKVC